MNRRSFLRTAVVCAASASLPRAAFSLPSGFDPKPGRWRIFEVTTTVELLNPSGTSRVWLPLPSLHDDEWIKPMGNLWSGNAHTMRPYREDRYDTQLLFAQWRKGESSPRLEVVSRFATRDRAVDWNQPRPGALSRAQRRLFTAPTELIPTDGIVRATAKAASKGSRSDLEKAAAIYRWIVDNTFRDPEVRGCGLGDIRTMLETGNLSGKCADLNALFVGMCRSLGIPARDLYGIRVADSSFGYKSLGKSGDISKAQHCRAEVWLSAYGWVPVDPADVRKVVLEERPGLTLEDPLVQPVRERLFGAWETNWLPYNYAHDLALPESRGGRIAFLMYPQGETAEGRLDSLEPAQFRYAITSRELTE
jgi:transglutaminase-like putative cysteine protease